MKEGVSRTWRIVRRVFVQSILSNPLWLGQVRLDQVRLGQVRLGQIRLGQVRLGQVMIGRNGLKENRRTKTGWTNSESTEKNIPSVNGYCKMILSYFIIRRDVTFYENHIVFFSVFETWESFQEMFDNVCINIVSYIYFISLFPQQKWEIHFLKFLV